jgi:thymidylate synthase (FAD)
MEICNRCEVELVDSLGSDLSVVRSARVSFGKQVGEELTDRDRKLIRYLADNKHLTPFESCVVTLRISCPLYVRAQFAKHRTFSTNDVSRRYTSENLRFFVPDRLRNQSKSNKQGSDGDLSDPYQGRAHGWIAQTILTVHLAYEQLISVGVAREQARAVLPQALMTDFYATGNLRNWVHFLNLRLDSHAQQEIRELAAQVHKILADLYPVSVEALLPT